MHPSGIERELQKRLRRVAEEMRAHDRGVIAGFVFGLVPILPVSLVGLSISTVNYVLLRRGVLDRREQRLVRLSLLTSTAGTLIAVLLAILVFMLATRLLDHGIAGASDLLDGLRNLLATLWHTFAAGPNEDGPAAGVRAL